MNHAPRLARLGPKRPIAGMHSTSAVFIVLKDGIGFYPGTGSFAIRL